MIRKTVARLIKQYKTRCPFEVASERNTIVLFEELGEMLGYYNTYRRMKMIHINAESSRQEQQFTCAHELGHSILHPSVNTPFLQRNTLHSIERIEREANQFAVELLIPDKLLLDGATLYEAAAICGVPPEVVHLKKPPKRSLWRDEHSFISL